MSCPILRDIIVSAVFRPHVHAVGKEVDFNGV